MSFDLGLLRQVVARHGRVARVLVADVAGSTPREAGAAMLIWEEARGDRGGRVAGDSRRTGKTEAQDGHAARPAAAAIGQDGTIGGGTLEYRAAALARELLRAAPAGRRTADLQRWPLGPAIGQCCGGAVTLVTEVFDADSLPDLQDGAAYVRALRPAAGTDGAALAARAGAPADVPRGADRRPNADSPLATMRRGARSAARNDDTLGRRREMPLAAVPDTRGGAQCGPHDAAPPLPVSRAAQRVAEGTRPGPVLGHGWLVERVSHPHTPLWIWGAGHVGRALAATLGPLPGLAVHWVDFDPARFPPSLPPGVTPVIAAQPEDLAASAPLHATHLIVTHSHRLDLELCHRLLTRGFAFCGLIGSATKWARFRSRLAALGHGEAQIARITCPIGRPELGKHPQAIAIGVAAELLAAQHPAQTIWETAT